MAKLEEKLDVEAVLNRIVEAAGMKNLADLAKYMGLSPQSLSQSKGRQMISLAFMLKGQKLTNKSLDYLIHGTERESEAEVNAEDETNYIRIERIGGGTVKVLAELLRQGVDAQNLRAYIREGKLYVIDSADLVVTTGVFAFGDKMRPAIRKCSQQIDGSVLVEGEAKLKSAEDLNRSGILGRVILQQVGD